MPEIRAKTTNSGEPPKTLRCGHCGSVIGAYTDLALSIGGAVYYSVHRGNCGQCRRLFKWRPGPNGKTDA